MGILCVVLRENILEFDPWEPNIQHFLDEFNFGPIQGQTGAIIGLVINRQR